jgi:hypothetical protein
MSTKTKKKTLTANEVARMGGKAVIKKYGKKHMTDLVNKRWGNKKKSE